MRFPKPKSKSRFTRRRVIRALALLGVVLFVYLWRIMGSSAAAAAAARAETADTMAALVKAKQAPTLAATVELTQPLRVAVDDTVPPLYSGALTPTDDEPGYLDELEAMLASAATLFPKARLSLALMARPGHRRRVMDLIGSTAPNASLRYQRYVLAHLVSRFNESVQHERDYATDPIRIRNAVVGKCDVPCTRCSQRTSLIIGPIDHPFSPMSLGPCDTPEERLTMENYPCKLVFDTHTIRAPNVATPVLGSTRLESDVTLLYFSWYDFGIMETPPTFAQKKELAASFISNCKFELRNEVLRNLITYSGGRIKSYGKCQKTDEEVHTASGEKYANKLATLRKYKFTLAFENSETKDYLSEKFWQALLVGSVPIVIGAHNAKFYAPDTGPYPYTSKAILTLSDFDFDGRKLTEYLVRADTDEALYQTHMEWKTTGYSDDFKALADLTSTHSSCRVCVVAADRHRWVLGPNVFDRRALAKVTVGSAPYALSVFVRERGLYAFHAFRFARRPRMGALVELVLEHMRPSDKPLYLRNEDKRGMPVRVYSFNAVNPRVAVLTDADLAALPAEGAELEVIFV